MLSKIPKSMIKMLLKYTSDSVKIKKIEKVIRESSGGVSTGSSIFEAFFCSKRILNKDKFL